MQTTTAAPTVKATFRFPTKVNAFMLDDIVLYDVANHQPPQVR